MKKNYHDDNSVAVNATNKCGGSSQPEAVINVHYVVASRRITGWES
jgi:hypothetical protein